MPPRQPSTGLVPGTGDPDHHEERTGRESSVHGKRVVLCIMVAGNSYPKRWALVRHYNINALRNSVKPGIRVTDGKWVIPTSYEEVYNYNKDSNIPMYNYFFGNASKGNNAYALQDSLNEFYNNSTDWWRYMYRTANVYNANLQASGGTEICAT